MGHSVRESNVKLLMSRRFVWLWPIFLAAGVSSHAQEKPGPAPAAGDALPPNVTVSSGPATAVPKPEDAPRPPLAVRAGGEEQTNPRFLGAMSCSSSLCHGGGSAERNAYTVWTRSDPHRHAAATLAGTYARQIAQGLLLGSPAESVRCTECHTPLATVPAERLSAGVNARTEGVSCESCHGPAQNWVRSHTRRDFTPAQNVQTGVREERNLYDRAGTCVACHQNIAPDLLAAGHPGLYFELDAQTAGEPPHWIDRGDFFGPQAWLTGQAVAWREMSWSLGQTAAEPTDEARAQWRALAWLLQRTVAACGTRIQGGELPGVDPTPGPNNFAPDNVAHAQARADDLARAASRLTWTRASTRHCLVELAATDKEFSSVMASEPPVAIRARAQRLMSALARLSVPLQKQDGPKWAPAVKEFDKLSTLANARATFDGASFGEQLRRFHDALPASGD